MSEASRGIADPSGIAKNGGSQLPKQRSSDTAAGGNGIFRSATRKVVTGTGRACVHPASTAEASSPAVSTIAASPWRAGLTSPTAPLTKRAGAPSFCSSRADARPMTSPDSRRSLAESIVPWMAKFHTSASGAPARVVSFSTTISWSSGLPSRLAVTAGAVTLVVAASAGTRARSARWTADTTPATSASLTAGSSRSTATRPISPELMNAPGPECVCDADTTSALDGTPARARRSWTAATSA